LNYTLSIVSTFSYYSYSNSTPIHLWQQDILYCTNQYIFGQVRLIAAVQIIMPGSSSSCSCSFIFIYSVRAPSLPPPGGCVCIVQGRGWAWTMWLVHCCYHRGRYRDWQTGVHTACIDSLWSNAPFKVWFWGRATDVFHMSSKAKTSSSPNSSDVDGWISTWWFIWLWSTSISIPISRRSCIIRDCCLVVTEWPIREKARIRRAVVIRSYILHVDDSQCCEELSVSADEASSCNSGETGRRQFLMGMGWLGREDCTSIGSWCSIFENSTDAGMDRRGWGTALIIIGVGGWIWLEYGRAVSYTYCTLCFMLYQYCGRCYRWDYYDWFRYAQSFSTIPPPSKTKPHGEGRHHSQWSRPSDRSW